ncbi:MAG: hypothetical protein ACR2NX_14550 [Chthoniobacterales bacterium]
MRDNVGAIEKAEAELTAAREERATLEAERGKIEGASAVELHRLSLTPAQAVEKSDALSKKAGAARAAEQNAEAKRQSLEQVSSAAEKRIFSLLKTFLPEADLLSQAEIMALLCSVIDSAEFDVPWSFEREPFAFYRHTFVHAMHAQRSYLFKTLQKQHSVQELLAFLDALLDEPLPSVARAEAVLPEKSGSRIIESIKQASQNL